MRVWVSVAVSITLALGPTAVPAASAMGTIEGNLTVDGRALRGVDLSLIDVRSGAVHTARSQKDGAFRVELGPGQYAVASNASSGLVLARGPALLQVAAGQVVSASLDLTAVAGADLQEAPLAPAGTATIRHEPVDCVVAGEHPMFDAAVEPAGGVQRVRLYFKSPASEFFYTEMLPTGGGFRGFLPRPTLEANPITYYIVATTTDFAEVRTPDVAVQVVEKAEDCKDRRVAPVGTPPPGTQFFTAAGAAGTPAGFAAGLAGVAAGGGGISTTALLIGAGLAGVTIAAVILSDDEASPSPSPFVPASPSPSPSATPVTPSPSPSAPPPGGGPGPTPPPPPTSPFQ